MGTADYMAPEQAFDSHTVDIRADIYSLGCTLYKLLTGHAPFSGPEYDNPMKKMVAHMQTPVPPVAGVRSDMPKGLVAVLDRMLAKKPDERFATPAEVAAAIAPFAEGCDLPQLLWRRPRKPVERPPRAMFADGHRAARVFRGRRHRSGPGRGSQPLRRRERAKGDGNSVPSPAGRGVGVRAVGRS